MEFLQDLYEWEGDTDTHTHAHTHTHSGTGGSDDDVEVEDDGVRSRGVETAVDNATILTGDYSTVNTDAVGECECESESDAALVPVVLCQCVRTLRCLLMGDTCFLYNRGLSEEAVVHYNLWMSEVLGLWAEAMTTERSMPLHNKSAILAGHVSYYSALVADMLLCCKCALHIMTVDSGVSTLLHGLGEPYATAVTTLASSSARLALTTLREVSNHLCNDRRVCKGDLKCMDALYNEAQCTLSFLAACLSCGHISSTLLELLTVAKHMCIDVQKHLGVQSCWLQTLLAGILYINLSSADTETDEEYATRMKQAQLDKLQGRTQHTHTSGDEGEVESDTSLRQRLCSLLASCLPHVLKVMEEFITVSSLQHTALLTVRLLLRLPYMNKKELEMFLEGDQATLLHSEDEARQERLIKLKEEHNLHDVEDDDISVEDFLVWKEKNLDEDDAFLDDWKGRVGVPIASLLCTIGEQNLQSLEVVEQWLLLIRHLSVTSSLALMSLAEAGVDHAIEKVLSIQNDDLYTVALARLCLAELEKLDQEAI